MLSVRRSKPSGTRSDSPEQNAWSRDSYDYQELYGVEVTLRLRDGLHKATTCPTFADLMKPAWLSSGSGMLTCGFIIFARPTQ
jgi:hypothetical protein